jgi:XRN 5'-3' exonuclease N-terminus
MRGRSFFCRRDDNDSSLSPVNHHKNHNHGGASRKHRAALAVFGMVSCCLQLLLFFSCLFCGSTTAFVVLPTPLASISSLRRRTIIVPSPPSPSSSSSTKPSPSSSVISTSTASSTTTALYGIPKMFRWLTDQYPDILNRQLEKEGLSADLKVDAFYLDMNGIIHPCTHGNNNDNGAEFIVLDETAMFKKIFLYVDRLYKLVRPSKVLYLAVDGVAPRAKMNQQRSRRFRSAAEAETAAADAVFQQQAKHSIAANQPLARRRDDASSVFPAEFQGGKRFDSNCITPGTDFMLKLSLAMQKVRIEIRVSHVANSTRICSLCTFLALSDDGAHMNVLLTFTISLFTLYLSLSIFFHDMLLLYCKNTSGWNSKCKRTTFGNIMVP